MIAENKKGRTTSERRGSEQPKTIFTNSKSQEKNKYENIWVFGYRGLNGERQFNGCPTKKGKRSIIVVMVWYSIVDGDIKRGT